MDLFNNWNFLLSLVTGLAAVIALVLTFKQIRLSNKQSLFNRRLECYLKIVGLMELYKENQKLLESDRKDEPIFTVEDNFSYITNNTYLEEVYEAIKKPLENPGHKKLLVKLEELKKLALEVDMIFKGRKKSDISFFILSYEQVLFKMYRYQIAMKELKKYTKQNPPILEVAQKETNEPQERKKLLKAYTKLKEAYLLVEKNNSMEKLKKQIQL